MKANSDISNQTTWIEKLEKEFIKNGVVKDNKKEGKFIYISPNLKKDYKNKK